jgi:L-lactate dehydrogenase complex protein LldF
MATTLNRPAGHVDHLELPFPDRYDTALGNKRLSTNITRYQQNWRVSRNNAMTEVDFIDLRDELRAAKAQVLDNLDATIDTFVQNATKNGATVHFAKDAEEATAIFRRIARERGITQVVKSKSMVSEEVELNHALEADGLEVVETDLGEWLVQKAGQRPSHIVGPALHMGREDVGDLLNDKLGVPVSRTDIPNQVHTIRDLIRPAFFTAGMGMTGANALIAETGTVMMATNEGNGRLASSAPPCHVVIAGIEKLVPTWDDAVTQVRLLGRSGTGQRMTVYTTFISGPTPGHEMHIVLVDNGRRAMNARPEFREALYCIRCGACANVCPPYREVGGHVFGHIYTGAIGLVVTPFMHGLDAVAKPQSMCLSCNACEQVCPVGIPLPQQILDVRRMVVARKGLPTAKKVVLNVYARGRVFDAAMRVGNKAQKPLQRGGNVRGRRIPGLKVQTSWRSLPAVANRPLRDRVKRFNGRIAATGTPLVETRAAGLTVALFPGCMTDRFFPEQGEAIVTTLRALGCTVVFPEGLHCCGLPAANSGDEPHAVSMAKQTLRALERTRADWVLSGSASCVATMAQDYLHMFRDDPTWLEKAKDLAARVVDFTTFLDKVAEMPAGSLARGGGEMVVTYHDSCQGSNALGLRDEPRRLLRDVLGAEVRELPENTLCCGFGGSFGFEYPEVSGRLMNRKLDNAESTGARVVVTDNQGCIMHLRGGCDAAGRPVQIRHLAELVADRIRAIDPARDA